MALCLCYGAEVHRESSPEANRQEAPLLISTLVLGVAIEELWRGSFWFSFMPAALLFILPVIGAGLVAALRMPSQRQLRRMVPATLTAAICIALSRNAAMAGITLCTGLTMLAIDLDDSLGLVSRRDPNSPFVLGVGIVAGLYGVNVFSSLFTYSDDVLGVFGTQSGLEVLSIVLSSAIFLGSGLMTSRNLLRRAHSQSLRTAMFDEGAAAEFLTGFGLPDIQVAVCVDTARGMTAAEISGRLNYSPITVRAARRSAFEKLDVRTASELQVRILAGIRRSQDGTE